MAPPACTGRALWVVRHAKAERRAPTGGEDRDRLLSARGRRDATALGQRLSHQPPALALGDVRPPDLALCSAATRTRQTAELIADPTGGRLAVEPSGSLYGADVEQVLCLVREVDEAVTSLVVVGHNPTMFELVWELLSSDDERSELDEFGFPTCALAVLALDVGSWEDVARRCGRRLGLFEPPY